MVVAPWERLCLLSGTRGAFALVAFVGAGGTVAFRLSCAAWRIGRWWHVWEHDCASVFGLRVAVALETLVGAGGTVDRYIAVALVALGAKFCLHPIGVWWAFPS